MAFNFKLPGLGGNKTPGPEDQTISSHQRSESGGATKSQGIRLAFLNQYSVQTSCRSSAAPLLFVIILFGALIYRDNRAESNYGTAYVAASGEMRMLSRRLAKPSTLLQGGPAASWQLRTRANASQLIEAADQRRSDRRSQRTASPDGVQEQLKSLTEGGTRRTRTPAAHGMERT